MNVSCTHCRTVYRVDPRKVPERGVRARCSACAGTFPVRRHPHRASEGDDRPAGVGAAMPAAAAPPPAAPEPAMAEPAVADAASTVHAPQPGAAVDEPGSWAAAPPAGAPTSSPEPIDAAPGVSPADDDHPRPPPRFGGQDPHGRAQRLARALVSDMITYHPERHQRGLREGTLRQEFREEIRKSWEEYVEQVGREIAHGTPYFRDALNQILSRGHPVF